MDGKIGAGVEGDPAADALAGPGGVIDDTSLPDGHYNLRLHVAGQTANIAGSGHTHLFYRNGGGTSFIVSEPINDEPATVTNGSTVAFSYESPEQVELFHATAVANGGTSIEDAPSPRKSAMGTIQFGICSRPRREQAV